MSSDYAGLSDGDLAERSIAGREGAFAEILKRHRDAIYRVVAASIGDPEESLDLVQETFLSAHAALRRYDPARPMRAWLSVIALNKCRDWARRRSVRRLFAFALPTEDAADRVADERVGQDIETEDREALTRAARAIAALPASLREILVLRTIEGLSQAEAAVALGISQKAVETRLRRARIRLAEQVAR